jgi:hypothetical protein
LPRALKIGAALALLAVLTWGGFQIHHTVKCRQMKEDVANQVALLRDGAAVAARVSDPKLSAQFKAIERSELTDFSAMLARVYRECGSRAGQTAAREAGL